MPNIFAQLWEGFLSLIGRGSLPKPTTNPNAPLVLLVRGLGASQLASVERAVRMALPGAQVVTLNAWHVGKGNAKAAGKALRGWLQKCKFTNFVAIGHSFGVDTIAEMMTPDAPTIPVPPPTIAQLVVGLDPVKSVTGERVILIPYTVARCVIYRRKDGGAAERVGITARAEVRHVPSVIFESHDIDASHNELPHKADVLNGMMPAVVSAAL